MGAQPPPEPDPVASGEVKAPSAPDRTDDLTHPHDQRERFQRRVPQPLDRKPFFRAGAYAWAAIGIAGLLFGVGQILGNLGVVWIPVVLALFPAAVLHPPTDRLRKLGVPSAAAALIVLVGTLALVSALFTYLAPQVADEFENLQREINRGYEQVEAFLLSGPFGLDPIRLDDLIEQARRALFPEEAGAEGAEGGGGVAGGAFAAARILAEGAAGTVLLLLTTFFFLKDGRRIGSWLRGLFPQRLQPDVEVIGGLMWSTVGAYIRGQGIVAFVDAVGIGIGLAILGVPLVLPLAVLTFFAGLFPIVGATVGGAVAALVALADGGITKALLVVAVVVGVQQLESHFLAPIILGRAVELHPLAVILSLTIGGVLLGVLGAFISIPIASASARAIGYWRRRVPDDPSPTGLTPAVTPPG